MFKPELKNEVISLGAIYQASGEIKKIAWEGKINNKLHTNIFFKHNFLHPKHKYELKFTTEDNAKNYAAAEIPFAEYLKNHINNQLEWINKSSLTGWNGKNLYVLQEGSMYNYHAGFVFLRVPSNSNKQVWVNLGTCIKQPCTDVKNQLETQISFNQW